LLETSLPSATPSELIGACLSLCRSQNDRFDYLLHHHATVGWSQKGRISDASDFTFFELPIIANLSPL